MGKFDVVKNEWIAWINMMPSAQSILHIKGTIDVGNESDSYTLKFDSIQKINPPNLVLKVTLKTIYIPREDGDTEIHLHYSQPAIAGQFGKIIILLPDGNYEEITKIPIAF